MARVGLFLNEFIVILKNGENMQCKEQQLKVIKKIIKEQNYSESYRRKKNARIGLMSITQFLN